MQNPGVSIDQAHADLVFGLVSALKPESVLEIGYGGGKSCDTILAANKANGLDVKYILVDNWCDWGGVRPEEAYRDDVTFVVMDEKSFSLTCGDTFDFIFSDGDHFHADEWFAHTYDNLLNPGGILVYHDVLNFPNLNTIINSCRDRSINHMVFYKNSHEYEACQRGLLVCYKPPM